MKTSRPSIRGFEDQVYKDSDLSFQSNEVSVLDACCTYFLYLSIGLHVGSCLFCGNTYVLYIFMYYPCYPGFR
jgi:hypothetical protein